jgi:hypothetical protein
MLWGGGGLGRVNLCRWLSLRREQASVILGSHHECSRGQGTCDGYQICLQREWSTRQEASGSHSMEHAARVGAAVPGAESRAEIRLSTLPSEYLPLQEWMGEKRRDDDNNDEQGDRAS